MTNYACRAIPIHCHPLKMGRTPARASPLAFGLVEGCFSKSKAVDFLLDESVYTVHNSPEAES